MSDPRDELEPWTTAQVAKHYAVRPARVLAWVRRQIGK